MREISRISSKREVNPPFAPVHTTMKWFKPIQREQLQEMTTTQLYTLYGEVTTIEEMIKAELTLRGDY